MENGNAYGVRVLVFAASLRKDSLNRRLASLAADALEKHGFTAQRAEFATFDCPSYNGDDDNGTFPDGAERLHEALASTDAFVIASPEYNGSIPGVLKNVIDWQSRYRPQLFKGKQCLLMSASPSMAGGRLGLWSMRTPLEHLGVHIYPDIFALAQAHQAFGDDGNIADETLRKRFEGNVECFARHVEALKHYPRIKRDWVEFLGERPDPATDRVEEFDASP